MSTPYIQLLYTKLMTEAPINTKALEAQFIMILVTEKLNETGALGALTKDQLVQLDAKKGGIKHELSTKSDLSNYGRNITSDLYSPKLMSAIDELTKSFIGKKATNMDKFLAEGIAGGKRSRKGKSKKSRKSRKSRKSKKSRKSRKSKSKKSKSRSRKN